MNFLLADSFTDALARLGNAEQKKVKTAVFDLQVNPARPGLRLHKLDRAKDPNFWSARVSGDLRIIVHRTDESLLLCYVGHHDGAYAWAERRRIERHPKTGAMQIVELIERQEETPAGEAVSGEVTPQAAPADVPRERYRPPLFLTLSDDELLSVGVPEAWLGHVRNADEDSFLDIAERLPDEAAEALLAYAATGVLEPAETAEAAGDPFAHPDAQRRFRVMENVDELERALDYPWEKWTVFLHPAQRRFVERSYNGPARIAGSAGTGKTVVALHRAVHLARRDPEARLLLTTFSRPLANALKLKLGRLAGNEPEVAGRIHVEDVKSLAGRLYAERFGRPEIAAPAELRGLLEESARESGDGRFTPAFLYGEWAEVVDAWQLESWEAYRDVARLGRKRRLGEAQRQALWAIFERLRGRLSERGLVTWPTIFARVTEAIAAEDASPFHCAVIDEAQDMGVPELRLFAAVAGARADGLFFAGDLGQRIFQAPFSWRALGVDVRGRSHTLKVNYRTSHQIRSAADRLLPEELADVDGVAESRRGTVSAFNGPTPQVETFAGPEIERAAVAEWTQDLIEDGLAAHEIGVFVRSRREMDRARAALETAGVPFVELSEDVEAEADYAALATMHLAKGLEFRAVAVMACDDEVIPDQDRIESIADEADLDEVYATERHLLYVACTRARERLLVTATEPESEFLGDLVD